MFYDRQAGFSHGFPIEDLGTFFENTLDCIFVLDADWHLIFVNKRAQAEIAPGREIVGRTLWEAFPEAQNDKFGAMYRSVMQSRCPTSFEAFFKPLDAWYEVQAIPLTSGIAVSFRNINVRRRAEECAHATAERYLLAARATNDLIWDWDLGSNHLQRSHAGSGMFGYSETELGNSAEWWEERIHPDDRDTVMREAERVIACGDERFEADYRFLQADGTYAIVHDRGFVSRDEYGRSVRMVGAMQDQSALHGLAKQLAERERRLETVFSQAMVAIMLFDLSGRLLLCNEKFCSLLGRSFEDLRNLNFRDYTHLDDLDRNQLVFEEHLTSGEPFQIEKRYLRPDSTSVWCHVHVSFVLDSSGVPESCIVVSEDITARKVAEEAMQESRDLLQSVIDSVFDLIFVKDLSGTFVLTNKALEDGCGLTRGLRAADVFGTDLSRGYEAIDREVVETREARSIDEIIPIKGKDRHFHTVKVPWISGNGLNGIIGVSRDITERQRAEIALKESEALNRSIVEACTDCVCLLEVSGDIAFINAVGVEAMEFEGRSQVIGSNWLKLWPRENSEEIESSLSKACAGGVARFSQACRTARGEYKWWDVVVSPVRGHDGGVVRLVAISRDITSTRAAADQLRWTSEHDGLTDLPNRRSFQTHLQAATIRAMESGGTVGLLLIDLDHFKHVNDTLGHAAGDHLLKTFGERLKSSVKENDFIARLGGDEFAVVLEGVTGQNEVLRAGETILNRMQAPISFDERVISAGASIGGALFPNDATSANDLFKSADGALYAMKSAGRGGTRMFHSHMRQEAQKISSQLNLARFAITEHSVVPHYQQKVDLKSGKIRGFEALLRWKHPNRGMQRPDTIAEAFKDYELASKIGELMQHKVFSDIQGWVKAGVDFGCVSINASPAEFLRDDYAEKLLARAAEYEVPGHLIEVEVTEHVFIERGAEYVARALKMLSKAGVRLSLDDFGTGYSSLSHLRDFPVDVVKIDRSFIAKMVEDPEVASIVTAVIELTASLSLEVVAEGVETLEQEALLRDKGCDTGQGYLFGRAVASDEVPILLRR